MQSLLETKLGGYHLTRVVASGGMAAVFEARHPLSGDPVAVKVLRRDLRRSLDPMARLMQEGRIICSLLHEHIVRVIDYGTAEETIAFIVMELLRGRTLADVLDSEETLAPERAAFIARQVCDGLAAAHARGIFHRDVKPANVFLVDGQRHRDFVKLLDFGIAKLAENDPSKLAATATGMTLGTPEYMSPEQATATHIDARSDVYQVGLLMYEMVAGAPPFVHNNPVQVMRQHLSRPPQPLREVRVDLSEEFERVVMRCLQKHPGDRYQSAQELSEACNLLAERDTAGQGHKTILPAARGTGPRPEALVVGNLRLPTLGSPGDLDRYARNLNAGLEHIWPDGRVPDELRVIQEAIRSLNEERAALEHDQAARRSDADALARDIESRYEPIERAIAVLESDVATAEARLRAAQEAIQAREERIGALDAEYARIYDAIEAHQSALYGAAAQGRRAVDFRDLFREDIAAELQRLEGVYRERSKESEPLDRLRRETARHMREIADLRLQISELSKSRLTLEAERATRLAEREFAVADVSLRSRAVERALEHRHLQLGLAFRRAVSRLLEGR